MIAADTFMVVFRIVHIVAGVFWVGSVFLFVVYLQPDRGRGRARGRSVPG